MSPANRDKKGANIEKTVEQGFYANIDTKVILYDS